MLSIEDAREELAKKHHCSLEVLEYIGASNCDFLGKGIELLYFNIMDASHVSYKSTVVIKNNEEI